MTSKNPQPQNVNTLGELWKHILGDVSGGRVLDIATAQGGFINVLTQNLKDHTRVTGVDVSASFIHDARNAFEGQDVHFCLTDAGRVSFKDASFYTVSLGVSLHHLADIPQALAEATRVLASGGHFVLVEMHRDVLTEAQRTGVAIHHWRAEVDTALGIPHYSTLTRQEIVDLVAGLGLRDLAFYDWSDPHEDPKDEGTIAGIGSYIDKAIQDAQGLSDFEALREQGEALRQRLQDVGAQNSPLLIAVGEK